MGFNYPDLLVQLIVPERGNSSQGRIGTAYPVAEGRVITAGHVLFGKALDHDQPFKARWYYLCDRDAEDGGWLTVEREAILWPGTDALDAALFELPFPPEVVLRHHLAARLPVVGGGRPIYWDSAGFADFSGGQETGREAVSAIGKLLPRASKEPLKLQLEGSYEHDDGWRGASGGPVIVGQQIIALLTMLPDGFDGTRLEAVPVPDLLANDELRQALGLPPRSDERRDAIAAVLAESDPDAVTALLRQLGLGTTGQTDNERAEWLLDHDASALLNAGIDVLNPPAGAGQTGQADPSLRRADLVQLVMALLPLLHDPEVIDQTLGSAGAANAVLLDLPVTNLAVAEAIMAGLEAKPVDYRPYQAGAPVEGRMSLSTAPLNRGFDPDGQRLREDIEKGLHKKFGSDAEQVFQQAFYHCMREVLSADVTEFDYASQPNDEACRDLIADELDYRFRRSGRHYYYVFALPEDGVQRSAWLAMFSQLHVSYQGELSFMQLRLDDLGLFQQQKRAFRALNDLLKP